MERYEKYKDSGVEWIGEIPEGWEVKKLKYILVDHAGNGFPNNQQGDLNATIPFYKVSDINRKGMFVNSSNNYVSPEIAENKNWNIVPKYSVIAAKIGEALKKNHRKITLSDCIIDNNCIGLEAKQINYKFNYHLLSLIDFSWFVNPGAVPSLSVEKFKNLKAFLPERKEQTVIVNYLDRKTAEIDELIAQKERLIELYEEERTAIINQAVTKGIDPDVQLKDSGVDWLGEIPEGWQITALKRLVNKITDGEHISPKFTQSGMPFLSAKDVRDGYIKFPDDKFIDYNDGIRFRKRCNPELNDVLIVSRGATVGRVAVINTNVEFCLLGSVILLKPKSEISSLYLFYSLKNKLVQDYFLHSSQSSAQQAIYLEKIAAVYFAIPTIEEQGLIVNYIETEAARINTKIAKTKKIIELQKEYRAALISEVVTGKIKVTEETTP